MSFVDSLVIGMKALMFSAEFVDIEEEEETEVSLTSGLTISSATKSRI